MTTPPLDLARPPMPDRPGANGNILVSIILPAYNEAEALPTLLSDLQRVADDRYEIIVVDDGSTDNTVAVASEYPCRVIEHQFNRGKGAAVQTGISEARGQYLVVMDADGTYPVSAIPRIVEFLSNHDLVRCNRPADSKYMPVLNRVGNRLFDGLLAAIHGLEGMDHLSGLYGFRREAILQMRLESTGFDIEAEIGIKAQLKGLRVTAFPVGYQPRLGQKKLQPWRDGFRILSRIVLLLLVYNPLVTFVAPGLVIMLLGIFGALILSKDLVFASYLGLSIHSFIVVTLGALAAFQLVVFGIAAALYGVEAGYQPPAWLIRLSSRPLRLGGAIGGSIMAVVAAVEVFQLIARWITSGAGLFLETRALVLASTSLAWGLQILSAALFLSIFAGRLERYTPSHPGARLSRRGNNNR